MELRLARSDCDAERLGRLLVTVAMQADEHEHVARPFGQCADSLLDIDLFAGLRDIVGGRSGSYEKELRRARDIALEEIQEAAKNLGANAVVAVDIDYEVLGEKNGMLMVSCSGTAVSC